ncbi:MAG: hypothetical protein AB1925_15925 [Actinomycetota bacterium]
MTLPGDPGSDPAPGSPVPGAPPALKRALTPADGVLAAPISSEPPTKDTVLQKHSSHNSPADASRWIVAAAMFGIAAGLELAGAMTRKRSR